MGQLPHPLQLLIHNVILTATSNKVSVPTANYSTPVITSAPPNERNPELKLTCTTQGGAPKPEITWINASDGTPIHERHIHNDIYQVEDFINVTSTVTINVTSTTNFSCVILTASGNLTCELPNVLYTGGSYIDIYGGVTWSSGLVRPIIRVWRVIGGVVQVRGGAIGGIGGVQGIMAMVWVVIRGVMG